MFSALIQESRLKPLILLRKTCAYFLYSNACFLYRFLVTIDHKHQVVATLPHAVATLPHAVATLPHADPSHWEVGAG